MTDPVHISDFEVYGSAWSTPSLRALFGERQKVAGWLKVMRILAEVQAEFGLIPESAALEIRDGLADIQIDEAFLQTIGENFARTNHSLLGLIEAAKTRIGPIGGEWLCYGVTVQDVTDTYTMATLMQVREQFLSEINTIERQLLDLARKYRDTPMCGRTHGQPGLPITFGFKVAGWLDEVERHRRRLLEMGERLGVGQLAGGVGSLSSLGPKALDLQKVFLQRMGLRTPRVSWTSSRDRLAEWLNVLALMTATGDRIGQEIMQLQRPEIGELSEGFIPGAVGSITMPQKRNPELSEHLGTLSRLVRYHAAHMMENLVHSHERDGRSWKSEWAIVPDATLAAAKSLALLGQLLAHLEVNAERMAANIAATRGFVFGEAVMLALAQKMGKQSAHRLIYEISMGAYEHGISLREALHEEKTVADWLASSEIDALFDAGTTTGRCAAMVDCVIGSVDLAKDEN